jgi:hypothetical protein
MMKYTSEANRKLARRVLEQEAGDHRDPAAIAYAAGCICQRLRDRLVGLIGWIGFEALLSRALKLTTPQFPCLREVRLDKDRGLEGLESALVGVTTSESAAALVALVASFLDLLAAFIGDDLASRLVGEALRDAPPVVEPDPEDP